MRCKSMLNRKSFSFVKERLSLFKNRFRLTNNYIDYLKKQPKIDRKKFESK